MTLSLGALLAWMFWPASDRNVHWIGPRNQTIQEMLHWLDKPVDPSRFGPPCKLRSALEWLHAQCDEGEDVVPILVDEEAFRLENLEDVLDNVMIAVPGDAPTMTRREFLILVLDQMPNRNATILLRHMQFLEVTTIPAADWERRQYESDVTLLDRSRQFWSEMWGGEGHLPPPLPQGVIGGRSKRLEAAS